jgi:NADH:ubiquinone oxidoreductase subunit 5 (subunit L)/multisubunit Na+/H+ antiporter MnhA subunit
MVTAGIFLLLRIATVLQWHLTIVGIVGGFTIGFGGTVDFNISPANEN